MTPQTLLQCMPYAGAKSIVFAQPLSDAMLEFNLITAKTQAAFLAQVCHESGSLKYTEEIADGSAYEGRADLGNTQPLDGPRFKGRGLLQITGRANYRQCGNALGLDLLAQPDLLATPQGACRSAAWFWKSRALNGLAESDKFGSLTKIINGGFNGLDDRIQHWLRIRRVLEL